MPRSCGYSHPKWSFNRHDWRKPNCLKACFASRPTATYIRVSLRHKGTTHRGSTLSTLPTTSYDAPLEMDPRGPAADELRNLAEQSRGVIDQLRSTLDNAASERQASAEKLGSDSAQLVESLAEQIATELSNDLLRQQDEQVAIEQKQLDAERSKLQAEREAWLTERTEWEAVRDQVENELAGLEADLKAETERLEVERTENAAQSQAKADQRFADADAALHACEQQLFESQETVTQLTQLLEETKAQLAAMAAIEIEHATLQEKFDLVLADLQAHREHVAELDRQLAERPETDGSTDSELSDLRNERDTLQRQLEETGEPHGGADEEMEDLRARFEMAVEDVRRLKNENADLSERVASGSSAPVGDDNDWEAQKRRLLASLEGEGESDDATRNEERATIAETVQITNDAIAEKERQIERLRSQIASDDSAAESSANDEAVSALLDEDEVIRVERERLAQLEVEWQEKLRAAELELSVERAKITRTQSELAEQQIELEALRAAAAIPGSGEMPSEGRRNWMKKLGLGADES